MVRIRVELKEVECRNPEDIGGDEFYLVGSVTDGNKDNIGVILTKPIKIKKKQTKSLESVKGGGIVFDADVPENGTLKIAMVAYDEDSAKDWSKHGDMVEKISYGVSSGLAATSNPYAILAGGILQFATKAVGGIMKLDKDDKLGTLEENKSVRSLAREKTENWNFSKKPKNRFKRWWSSWDYTVRYKITKG